MLVVAKLGPEFRLRRRGDPWHRGKGPRKLGGLATSTQGPSLDHGKLQLCFMHIVCQFWSRRNSQTNPLNLLTLSPLWISAKSGFCLSQFKKLNISWFFWSIGVCGIKPTWARLRPAIELLEHEQKEYPQRRFAPAGLPC
jgi:hypothetical protein